MSNPKETAETDQAIAALADIMPRATRAYFEGLLREGFSRPEAIVLTQTWLAAFICRPSSPDAP